MMLAKIRLWISVAVRAILSSSETRTKQQKMVSTNGNFTFAALTSPELKCSCTQASETATKVYNTHHFLSREKDGARTPMPVAIATSDVVVHRM
eukprot:SAG31_NODE_10812_length_1094_cov_1.291457_1_plen_94_part_00